jgi:hypothetical protein
VAWTWRKFSNRCSWPKSLYSTPCTLTCGACSSIFMLLPKRLNLVLQRWPPISHNTAKLRLNGHQPHHNIFLHTTLTAEISAEIPINFDKNRGVLSKISQEPQTCENRFCLRFARLRNMIPKIISWETKFSDAGSSVEGVWLRRGRQ